MRFPLLALALTTATAAVPLGAPDVHVRVDPKGPGSVASTTDYTSIQQALDHAPDTANGRVIIGIVPGVYRERVVVTRNRPHVTFLGLGKSPEDVVITASQNHDSAGGTFLSATVEIDGDQFEADNLTFENAAGNHGQAVAIAVRSDRAVFKHCRFLADQDTLFADFGRQYYVESYIRGGVDFIFGNATAVFDHDTIEEIRPGYLTAQSRTDPAQTTGYVIANSKIVSGIAATQAAEGVKDPARKTFYLGRPWRLYSRVIFMHDELPAGLDPAGGSVWNKSDPYPPKAFYAEFQNNGPGADTSKRAEWSHQLTAEEATQYESATFLRGSDNWDPIAVAAKLPDPPVQLSAEEDHQRLMDQLHIAALRPPISHDPKSANPTNFDEAKANPWPDLPDPLKLANGRRVATPEQWYKQRRPELLDLFSRDIVGRVPNNAPAMTWRIASQERETVGGTPVITQHLIGHAGNAAYPLLDVDMEVTLTRPANTRGPVPLVVELTFENYPRPRAPALEKAAAPPSPADGPTWKEQVIARGWGYALLYPTTLQPDNAAGLTSGIIGLANHGRPRSPDQWGALRAWAWGASRLLDHLQTDPAIDAHRIAIEGHSRFGKAALVAMAYDTRFAVLYSSSSGAGGANLARRRFGEQMENIAAPAEYYWMAGNYLRYAAANNTPADMPVDMHELIALCAPRPVFIGGGVTEGDGWADTRGTFLAEVAAGPVYRLLGKRDLGTTAFPPVGTALISGDLGFRQHNGGHTPLPNYPTFLEFAGHYFGAKTDTAALPPDQRVHIW